MLRSFLLILMLISAPLGLNCAVSQDSIDKVLKEAENMFDNNEHRPKAYALLMEEYRKADDAGDRKSCAYYLQKYASFLWIDDNPSNGLMIFQSALSYCPEDEQELKVLITQGIGQTYCELGQYKYAEEYLNESLELSDKIGYSYGRMMAFHNLGILYLSNKDFTKATKVNRMGLELAQQLDDTYMEGSFLVNLSQSESSMSDKLSHLTRCIQICDSMGDSLGAKRMIPYAWYTIARSQLSAAQYDEALQNAQKALSYSDHVDEADYILASTYSLLADIYAAQKDYNSAYHYNELYRKVRNKSDSQLKNRKGVFINDFREIEHRTNDYLEHKNHTDVEWWKIILAGFIVMVFLAGLLIFARLRVYRMYRVYKTESKVTIRKYEILLSEFNSHKKESDRIREDSEKTIYDLTEQNRLLTVFKESRNILLKKISDMVKDISDSFPIADQVKFKNLRSFINNSIMDSSDKESGKYGTVANPETPAKDFKAILKERFPNLSSNEVQLCEYFQMGLNTREISQLSGKPIKTVNMARYRLRKSLGLSPEEDLHKFLLSLTAHT